MKLGALPLIALAVSLCAQAPAKAPETPKITDAHRAEFFKRQLAYDQAAQAQQTAQAALSGAVADMTKDCGEKFRPQMDAQGDPVCVAVAATPTPKAK